MAHSTADIRNIALVGHAGSGKTLLAEALLAGAGAIPAKGSLDRGSTVCDFDAQEKRLLHSLDSAVCHFETAGTQVNLLDTPGIPDFIGRSLSVLEAVETAAVFVSAVAGVEPMTQRMMDFAKARGLCRLIVINKIDSKEARTAQVLDEIREAFGKACLPLNLPAEDGQSVVDCFYQGRGKATDFSSVEPAHTEIILRHLGDEADTKGRFFAWYHLLDPHDQYMGHPEGKSFGKGAAKLYDGELYFVDMHLKKIFDFVDAQPWGKRTMIVVTADHGEAFGEKKMYRHGFELWNVITHVPLVIRAPGITPRKIDAPRGMLDLTQTILEAFEVPKESNMHGTSLVPELYGGDTGTRDVVIELTRTSDNDRRRALVRGDYKIIECGDTDAFQLYNLKEDPREAKDLARVEKEKLEEMRAALKEAASKIKERCPKMTEKLKGRKKGKPC